MGCKAKGGEMKLSINEFHDKVPSKGNSIENIRDKEVETLKSKLKRSQEVSKAIWKYRDYLEEIIDYLKLEEPVGAGELFEEIPYKAQKLLMTAPLYGGVFTTAERAIMRTLWIVKQEDVEND